MTNELKKMFSLKDKSAVITGGGSGIGKAIAENFAANGATVYIIELNKANAQNTLDTIQAAGNTAYVYAADVSKQEQVKQIIDKIEKRRGCKIPFRVVLEPELIVRKSCGYSLASKYLLDSVGPDDHREMIVDERK